jgi:hypothetical protein
MIKGGDPLIRIQFESSLNKLNEVEVKLRFKVYAYYLNYLVAGDYLQQMPLVNYFTDTLRPLSEN